MRVETDTIPNHRDIKRIIDYFKGRKEVSALYLFGSAAKGKQMEKSDIDIAVLVDETMLKEKTYERFKREYYAVSPWFSLRGVDIVILNTASVYLKYHILKTGRLLFDRNRRLKVEFTEKAITDYLDFKPIEDFFLKAVADRFRRKAVGR